MDNVAENILKNFDRIATKTVERMAVSGLSLLQDRIQNFGVKGAKYSGNKIPVFYLEDKYINSGGENYIKTKKKKGEKANYGEFREANGRQNKIVDLTFTSRMWVGFKLIRVFAEASNRFASTVGGTDEEVSNKLGWAQDRYGKDVFNNTQDEINEIVEEAEDGIQEFLNNLSNE